jgi:hypothetical protein
MSSTSKCKYFALDNFSYTLFRSGLTYISDKRVCQMSPAVFNRLKEFFNTFTNTLCDGLGLPPAITHNHADTLPECKCKAMDHFQDCDKYLDNESTIVMLDFFKMDADATAM